MSESTLQELIVRMATDSAFADSVRTNAGALSRFDLSDGERAQLTALAPDSGASAIGLAARQSKSGMLFMGVGHLDGTTGFDAHLSHGDGAVHAGGAVHTGGALDGIHEKPVLNADLDTKGAPPPHSEVLTEDVTEQHESLSPSDP